MDALDLLDGTHALPVLVYLKHNRPAIKTEIYDKVSRNSSMQRRLEELQDYGLITMYSSPDVRTVFVVLTDKGEKVAGQIEELIETAES